MHVLLISMFVEQIKAGSNIVITILVFFIFRFIKIIYRFRKYQSSIRISTSFCFYVLPALIPFSSCPVDSFSFRSLPHDRNIYSDPLNIMYAGSILRR